MLSSEKKSEKKVDDKKVVESEKIIEKSEDKNKDQSDLINKDVAKEKNKDNNITKIIAGIVVGLIILLLLSIAVMGVGIYKFNWSNQFTKSLPFPVAMVDGSFINFGQYQNDIDTLNFFYSAQADTLGTVPTDDYLQKTVMSRMIREKYLDQYAKTKDIQVTSDEINNEYQTLVSQAGSETEVNDQLLSLYNWNSDQFKEKVLRPYLVRSKIQDKLIGEDTEAKALAESILAKIKNEEITFENAAKEYSEDVTASEGGELGYFSSGQMVPEFETAAFALEVGAISDIVQTDYGYHIIKLIERIEATEDAAEQLNAAHILIKTVDIDEWTNKQLAELSIRLFINSYEWKDDCGLVLTKTETCDNNNLIDYLNTTAPTEDTTAPTEDTTAPTE